MKPLLLWNQHLSPTFLVSALPLCICLLILLGVSVINIGINPEELSGRYKLLPLLSETLYTILFVFALLSTAILIGLVLLGKRERRKRHPNKRAEEAKRSSLFQVLSALTTLLLPLLIVLYLYHYKREQVEENLQHLFTFFRELSAFLQGDASLPVYESPLLGYLLFGALSFLFVAFITLGAWLLIGGTEDEEFPETPPFATDPAPLLQTIEASLDNLLNDHDPRRAIIATYYHFERLLASQGFVRCPSSTSLEFMQETLRQLPIPVDHIQGLTVLFQQAKFSHHPIHERNRVAALAHLEAIRASLLPN